MALIASSIKSSSKVALYIFDNEEIIIAFQSNKILSSSNGLFLSSLKDLSLPFIREDSEKIDFDKTLVINGTEITGLGALTNEIELATKINYQGDLNF